MKKSILIVFAVASAFHFSAQTASAKDQKFAKEAAEASMKEIKFGQLAQAKGASPEIKSLGKMMADDHTKANGELMALAGKKGMTLPTEMCAKDQQNYLDMSKKSGADFDKAYADCMVDDHKKAIDLFKKEAKDGDDAEFKSWASTTEPTLEHHKMMSEQACKAVKK